MQQSFIANELKQRADLVTPAFVFDSAYLHDQAHKLRQLASSPNVKILYSLKACRTLDVVKIIANFVNGFSCSSLRELEVARQASAPGNAIHFYSPAFSLDEIQELLSFSDFVIANSVSQFKCLANNNYCGRSLGVRVNPNMSFAIDQRYNPNTSYCKLGISLSDFPSLLPLFKQATSRLEGLHIHNNCDSQNPLELAATIDMLVGNASRILHSLSWINVGGGYLYPSSAHIVDTRHILESLQKEFDLTVYLEPGAAFVREAGYLVSTVLDITHANNTAIAILDTTVNHWPEVFEYQFEPDVFSHTPNGIWHYLLAGKSCLAGDVFGEYTFDEKLEIGTRIVFTSAGAYSLVKAHEFNGIVKPSVYIRQQTGQIYRDHGRSAL